MTNPTKTLPYPAHAAHEEPAPEGPGAPVSTAPALNPPVWSGRKTAIAAALAIGISAMGAVGAAAAFPVGSTPGGTGQFQPGGPGGPGGRGQGGPGQQGTQPGTVPQNPNSTQQLPGQPGQGAAPTDPDAAPANPNASTT